MKKTIILGTQEDFFLTALIKQNLIYNNFDVIDISFPVSNFKYKNIVDRARNLIRKTLFGDKSFKANLKFKANEDRLRQALNKLTGKADYALFFRPDTFPEHFLYDVKSISKSLIGYQWDGLKRFPSVEKMIPIFDSFFVFDSKDYSDSKEQFPNLQYTTNFFFDIPRLLLPQNNFKNEIVYIGSFIKERMPDIFHFISIIAQQKIRFNINIIVGSKRKITKTNLPITYSMKHYTYEENIEMVKNASTIIDFNYKLHTGLSFRPFEALCFEKKLITNNRDIKFYDFYKKENIFIIGEDDEQELENFLHTPYQKIDPAIKQKYSFTNWIHYLLNIQPHLAINPPVS